MQTLEHRLAEDNQRVRRDIFLRRVLDGLRQTIQLRGLSPDVDTTKVVAELTNESAVYLAPLAEAVDILESIIWASDGCMGHRNCLHSMEPWERARALLQGKWEADMGHRRSWPGSEVAAS